MLHLYVNNNYTKTYPIREDSTTSGIWKGLNEWLLPQNINFRAEIVMNDGTTISINNRTDAKSDVKLYPIRDQISKLTVTIIRELESLETAPLDILYMLVMDYTLEELNNLCLVSRTLNNRLCNNEELYRRKFQHDYGTDPTPYKTTTYKNLYLSTVNLLKQIDYIKTYYDKYPEDQLDYYDRMGIKANERDMYEELIETATRMGNQYIVDFIIKNFFTR